MSKNKQEVEKSKKNVNKKPNVFVRMGRAIAKGFKSMFSELKKVSWPSFGKVVKQTGIVLGVVLIFLIAVCVCDFALEFVITKLVTSV